MSESPKQLVQLTPSDPVARARVEQAIKEISDNNPVVVWRSLSRELAGREIPELCHILGESHQWDVIARALLLLNYSSVRPQAATWQSLILAAADNHVAGTGHVQDAALKLIQKLRVERRDVWRCLFECLQMVQDSRAAYGIASVICDFTPPEERAQTGAILLDLLFFFDDSPYDEAIKNAIGSLNYRTAIPTLREVFSRYALKRIYYKVTCATDLLAEWNDKDAAPHMRSYIDTMYRESISMTYFNVIKGLYRIEGASCAKYIADRILNSSPANQHSMNSSVWQDYKNEPEVMKAVRLLGERSQDTELKKNVESFFTSLARQ